MPADVVEFRYPSMNLPPSDSEYGPLKNTVDDPELPGAAYANRFTVSSVNVAPASAVILTGAWEVALDICICIHVCITRLASWSTYSDN